MTMVTEHQHWSLSDLPFTSLQALESGLAQLESQLAVFEKYRPRLADDLPVDEFLEILHLKECLHESAAQLGAYAYLNYAQNTQDPAALSLQARLDQLLTGVENRSMFFSLWFKSLPAGSAAPYIEAAGDLSYYLEASQRFQPFTLSEPEEKIINLKDTNGIAGLVKIYEIITNGMSFQLEIDGQVKTLSRDGLTRHYHHPSPQVRAATYQELYRVFGAQKIALAEIYAYLVRDWHAETVGLRGYPSPIAIRNLVNDLHEDVVSALLEVCRKNAALFQRYFRLKARLLGIDRLKRYDVYAPLAKAEKTFELEEAVRLILGCFQQFSPVVAQAAARVLDECHLDAGTRPGKRGGAFCYSVTPGLTPWVLVNFSGGLRDVTTLAHELGHAIHNLLAGDHSVLNFHAPLPLAETASVFAEMLVTDRLLEEESDPAVQRDLLMTILDDAYATVQRQAFFSIFERDAHEMVAAGCTSEELAAHYYQNLVEQFGESLELPAEFAWEWITVPHIYNSPFYTYAYSFGQLLVLALYQQYLDDPSAFVPRYLKLLSYGGSANPQTILAEAGLDITSAAFWQGGYTALESKLNRLEQITGGIQ